MSLLPVSKSVKVFPADNDQMAWGVIDKLVGLVDAKDARTFEIVTPCAAGKVNQHVAFRSIIDPNLFMRHDEELGLFMNPETTNSETFVGDSCYSVEPSKCDVQGSVVLRSSNLPSAFIAIQEDGSLKLEEEKLDDKDFQRRSCFVIQASENIEQFIESQPEDPIDEEIGSSLTVKKGVVAFEGIKDNNAEGVLTIGAVSEKVAAEEEMYTSEEGEEPSVQGVSRNTLGASSGNLDVGASGGFGAGGGSGTSGTIQSSAERDFILDFPMDDIDSSGGLDFRPGEINQYEEGETTQGVVSVEEKKKSTISSQIQGMSVLQTAAIISGAVLVLSLIVFFARRYHLMEKVMGTFNNDGIKKPPQAQQTSSTVAPSASKSGPKQVIINL
jgi:hypothetical protein